MIFAIIAIFLMAASKPSVDRIVVYKSERLMLLLRGETLVRSYIVSLGTSPVGPKRRRGDHKTPEGSYRITGRNPHSGYHKSLRISYPSPADVARAGKMGVSPGGDIMIHGLKNGYGHVGKLHRMVDWTDGCIAVTNEEMDEVWDLVKIGTPIEIKP